MKNFLSTMQNPGIYGDDKAGLKLKDGRKWAHTRIQKPYSLNFRIPERHTSTSKTSKMSGNKFDVEQTPSKF